MFLVTLCFLRAALAAPSTPSATDASGTSNVRAALEQVSTASAEQKRANALQGVAEIEAVIADVDRLFVQARDASVQECVRQKGVTLRKVAAIAKAAQDEMVVRLSDPGLADYQLRRVIISVERARQLRNAALACTPKNCKPDASTDGGLRGDDVKTECAQARAEIDVTGTSESLVEVTEEDVVVVEPPQASPN